MPLISEIMKKTIVTLAGIALTAFSFLPGEAVNASSRRQCGGASYYGLGDGYQGGTTASGKRFDTWSNQAAHKWLPFGTVVTVTANGRSTKAVITDRGPFVGGRIIDLSAKSFSALGPLSRGVHNVCISW
jgi:rare lipoprotein A (peptidoglycan hydrolase)